MANKAFEFIKKTNQVLIFIGAIVVIFAVVKTSILPKKNSVYQPSQVSIAKADKEGKDTFKPVYKQLIMENVVRFEMSVDNLIMIRVNQNNTTSFYLFDILSNTSTILDTKLR